MQAPTKAPAACREATVPASLPGLQGVSQEELARAVKLLLEIKDKGYDVEEFKLALEFGGEDGGWADQSGDDGAEEETEEVEEDGEGEEEVKDESVANSVATGGARSSTADEATTSSSTTAGNSGAQ